MVQSTASADVLLPGAGEKEYRCTVIGLTCRVWSYVMVTNKLEMDSSG